MIDASAARLAGRARRRFLGGARARHQHVVAELEAIDKRDRHDQLEVGFVDRRLRRERAGALCDRRERASVGVVPRGADSPAQAWFKNREAVSNRLWPSAGPKMLGVVP